MLSLGFISAAEDLVFFGQTGRGKTHMATAPGIAAASAGHPVRLWQTAQLVTRLGKAKREGTPGRLLADVGRSRLLVLDEFGYVPSTWTARGCCSRSYPRATRGGASCSPRT